MTWVTSKVAKRLLLSCFVTTVSGASATAHAVDCTRVPRGIAPLAASLNSAAANKATLYTEFERLARAGRINGGDVRGIDARLLATSVDPFGRVTPAVQEELFRVESEFWDSFSPNARAEFQSALGRIGARTNKPIQLPRNKTPFWQKEGHPLANYQSGPTLPAEADVVIIGAGLTGASAAYHLSEAAQKKGLRVVVLDSGDPATQATGRNGGNFELAPENWLGQFEGLERERFKRIKLMHPDWPDERIAPEARAQAVAIMKMGNLNRQTIAGMVKAEGLAVDFSPKGWLRIAADRTEEKGIEAEAALAEELGIDVELWSPEKIREEYNLPASFKGRFTPGDGTYHPFKFVNGVLQASLDRGVELYTRTAVTNISSQSADKHTVMTARGPITAKRVIVGTNAFTRELLPELSAIEPYKSEVQTTEHVKDSMRGRIATTDKGDIYFNQPRQGIYTDAAGEARGTLLMGGGLDRPMANPHVLRRSNAIFQQVMSRRNDLFPDVAGQVPSASWAGPMAFTEDRAPVIGEVRPGIWVSAAYNGYGGTFAVIGGKAVAEASQTGALPDYVPAAAMSPLRFNPPN